MLVERKRYLIDETAVVRFIVPCGASKREHGDRFDLDPNAHAEDLPGNVADDVRLLRSLFFNFFVEAVVSAIQGEDVIWLLEDSPLGRRLYTLDKAG